MNNYINYNWIRKELDDFSDHNNLCNPKDGYMKGNMFKNLYSTYKNYEPVEITFNNEQEKCLYELSMISFAAHELNLYLDLHPDNQTIFMLWKDYQKKSKQLLDEYEKKFGSITINSDYSNSYDWVKNNWPWEGYHV